MRRLVLVIALAEACLIGPVGLAHAAPGAADQQVAQTLFDNARRLMKDGKYTEACPMLEASQRLDPGGGTLLNLAICHEKEGKLATAHAEYSATLSLALASNRADRQRTAQKALAALAPRLPRLRLIVVDPPEGLSLSLDGTLLPRAAWAIPTPLDPGPHAVSASAPGKTPVTLDADLREGVTTDLTIPALATVPRESPALLQRVDPLPAPAPLPPCDGFLDRDGVCQHPRPTVSAAGHEADFDVAPSPPRPPRTQVRHQSPPLKNALVTTTILTLTGGLLLGATALAFRGVAHCDATAQRCDDQASLDHAHTARSLAWASTLTTGVSAVSFLGYLLIPDRTVTVDVVASSRAAGLVVGGAWR
jgi:hypothetical protein